MTQESRTVSLVLGSGGARGHAHIGVIRALHEMGFEVRNISGCSMGSVIGGIYAADKLDTYTEWAFELTRGDAARGFVLGGILSTSQLITIFLVATGIAIHLRLSLRPGARGLPAGGGPKAD